MAVPVQILCRRSATKAGILGLSKTSGRRHMSRFTGSAQTAIDYNSTIIGALELSSKMWVLAIQLPGVDRHSRHVLDAGGDGLVSFVARLKARCAAAGREITRVILTHEAGRDGFWLARFLARHNIEVHVMQPSSLPWIGGRGGRRPTSSTSRCCCAP